MSRRPLLLALAALALLGIGAGAAVAETEATVAEASAARAAAAALVARAVDARRSGDPVAAADLVRRALELAPRYPDALYVRALIALDDRSSTRQARDDLRAAVADTDWKGADAAEAARALGAILVRTRRYAEAIPVLEGLLARRADDPRTLLTLAEAYRGAGRADEARASLSRGRARFRDEPAFALGLAAMLAAAGRAPDAVAVVDAAVADRPGDARLLLRRAALETEAGRRLAAVERALAAGSADPLAPVLALESRPPAASATRYLEQFLGFGGLSRSDLAERVARAVAGDAALAAKLARAMEGFTGSRELDRDGDGWWEERWDVAAGAIVRWTRDADQDGVAEYEAVFAAGRPVSLAVESPERGRSTFLYGVYPWVDRVVEPFAARTWTIATRALGAPFLGEAAPRVPSSDEVLRAAVRLEEPAAPGSGARRVEMKDGRRLSLEEDTDGDGRVDHRLWYTGGEPVRGERDLAGDGVFEAAETWVDGALARLSVDTDGNGRSDYAETYRPAARLWDYNEDGRDDSRETSDGKGGLVREFSTKADGRFDLRIVFRGAAIQELRKSGRTLTATPDAKRGVTWIGPVPANPAIDASADEGYRTFGGREYLVFRHAGIVYAEALP